MEKQQHQTARNQIPKPPAVSPDEGSLNLSKAQEIWGRQFRAPEDLFCTTTVLPGKEIISETHLLGLTPQELNLIEYDDSFGHAQTRIAEHIAPGEVAISIKHHSPRPQDAEQIKLQCTHIQIAVGVKGGVVTVNNPQSYQRGLFGDEDYPMIFVKPKLPSNLTPSQTAEYIDNIRTWSVITNTFTKFPGNYDGGDPLTCVDKESILKMGHALINALKGDAAAREWLKHPDQFVYCAELALLSLNLGLYFPLNKHHLGAAFDEVQKALDSGLFLDENDNGYIKMIERTCAPDYMLPMDEVFSVGPESEKFWNGMAVAPFCIADMVEHFIQKSVPRAKMGEVEGAKYQAIVFQKVRPSLKSYLKIEGRESEGHLENTLDEILKIISKPHVSYQEFRTEISPILQELSKISLKYGHAYIPPHCYLIRATEFIVSGRRNGVLGWEYLGHGLHGSLFNERGQ